MIKRMINQLKTSPDNGKYVKIQLRIYAGKKKGDKDIINARN